MQGYRIYHIAKFIVYRLILYKIHIIKHPTRDMGDMNGVMGKEANIEEYDPAFLFEFEREEQLTYGDKKKRNEDECSTGFNTKSLFRNRIKQYNVNLYYKIFK